MNKLRNVAWLGLAMVAASAVQASAASLPPPGAASCSGCHGPQSNAASPLPTINGRDAADIVTTMAAFRDGSRPATLMNRIAKGFTDDEMRPIAAWLAAQKQGTR